MYKDYKTMSDAELAGIMVNILGRAEELSQRIGIGGYDGTENIHLKGKYASLKEDVKAIADYLNLVRNRSGSEFYIQKFANPIRKASACFRAKSNGSLDEIGNSLAEVLIELGFFHAKEDYITLAEQEYLPH